MRHGIGRWPLRARIIAVLAGLLGAAMLVIGTASSWQLETYLVQREDADLQAAAPTLVSSTIEQEQTQHVPRTVPVNVYAARIVDGRTTHDYVPASGPRPAFTAVTKANATAREGTPYTVSSQGDDSDVQWRVVEGVDAETGQPYAVAVSLANVRTVVRRMQVLTVGVSSLALLIATVTALWAVRRALRPLRDIEDTAAAIAGGDLTRRVPSPGTGDEVESLAHSLNVMLSQVERSMAVKDRSEESMRRFVADASHELRTPLATVRGYAELYRQGAVTQPEHVAAVFTRLEDEATRMTGMVENLLLLSRLETEQRAATIGAVTPGSPTPRTQVDLTVIAADAVADAGARCADEEKRHTFRLKGLDGPLGPVHVDGDEQRLRQVVTNLLSNCERYTPAGTLVDVFVGLAAPEHPPSSTTQGGAGEPTPATPVPPAHDAVIQVVDHGPGIASAMRERVFERFFRADVARDRAAGSTGLGLSIVSAIVQAHGGTIRCDETPGGGATFTVRLPQQKAQAGHSTDTVDDDHMPIG